MTVAIRHNDHHAAHEFLKQHKVAALATVGSDNAPHVAAIYYLLGDHLHISFVTKAETRKAANLDHKKHAMILVYDESSQTTAQLEGPVIKITDQIEVGQLYSKIIENSVDQHDLASTPQAKIQAGAYVAYRLEPRSVRLATFRHAKVGGSYQDTFQTIELKPDEAT